MKKPMKTMMGLERFDNLYTPREAITPLLKYIPNDINIIWECTDYGESMISKVFEEHKFFLFKTDLVTGFNFLTNKANKAFDMIVTNPPYSLKDQFIEKCYEYNKPFALLLPLTALEGIKRGKMFGEKGISVIVLNKRIDFTGKKANWFNVSWFCWGFLPNNSLIFEEVE